jgi:H+/gluconate symporter-like permease
MLIGIAIMIIGAYRGLQAIPLTILAALVVSLTNGLSLWETFAKTYAGGFGGVITAYFFIFVSSSVYALIMEKTGCAAAIGYKFIDWFGTKYVMLVSLLFVSVLTYGGVSLFVVIFATMPILFLLFKAAGLPRHLMVAPLAAGSSAYTMTTLPGTPALTNVIPSQYLGTPMTAAPIFSLIIGIVFFILCYWYCLIAEKICRKNGEQWSYPEGYDTSALEVDRSKLPSAGVAFTPIVVLIIFIIGSSLLKLPYASDAALLTTLAMNIAAILCIVMNLKRLSVKGVKDIVGKGSLNGISAIIGLASVVAFGGVVSSSPAFKSIVSWVLGLNMSAYFKGIFSTAVIAGITGSSSGGVRIMLQNIGEYLIQSGANLEVMHRLIAIAAGSLDSLPHSSSIFLTMALLGLTHKEGFKHFLWPTVIIPSVLAVVFSAVATVVWPV